MLFSASSSRDKEQDMKYFMLCEDFRPSMDCSIFQMQTTLIFDDFNITIPYQLKKKPTQKWPDKDIGKIHPSLELLASISIWRAQIFSLKQKNIALQILKYSMKIQPNCIWAAKPVWICRQYNYCWEVSAAPVVSHKVPLWMFKALRGFSLSQQPHMPDCGRVSE